MLSESLDAENTNPPTPEVGDTRPTPRLLSPWKPTVGGFTGELLGTGEFVTLKLKPGTAKFGAVVLTVVPGKMPRRNSIGLCKPNSAPNSWLSLSVTSAIRTWMTTCGG